LHYFITTIPVDAPQHVVFRAHLHIQHRLAHSSTTSKKDFGNIGASFCDKMYQELEFGSNKLFRVKN
jgi:hypothetical protein